MKTFIHIVLVLLLAQGFGCRKECKKPCQDASNPDCENYDPCHNIKPANADFGIFEVIGEVRGSVAPLFDETDTIYQINGVSFKFRGVADKVTWTLGSETITQKEFYRSSFPKGWITITIIAEVNPSHCLQQKDLYDTLTKRFYVFPYGQDTTSYKALPWWGTWKGVNTDEPNDSFTISWGFIYKNMANNMSPNFDFTGLPKGLPLQKQFYKSQISVASITKVFPGYKALQMFPGSVSGVDDAFDLQAVIRRDNANRIIIEYIYDDANYKLWLKGINVPPYPNPVIVSKVFKGKKISNAVFTQ